MKKQSATPCYIDYLSKAHNFRQVRKEFTSLVEAMEWGRKNLSNFHIDMVKITDNQPVRLF